MAQDEGIFVPCPVSGCTLESGHSGPHNSNEA